MTGLIDLHCHCLPGVDDGARSIEESRSMLLALRALGFDEVAATPHMRPGLFDNTAPSLSAAFSAWQCALGDLSQYPRLALSAEHYFDDVVFTRILAGEVLPYPGGRSILLEFYDSDFPYSLDLRLADICRRGMTCVVAHPERYQPLERKPEILERLLDLGAVALLDICALVGKYGRRVMRTSQELLERGLYRAACTDAHHPTDLKEVARGIEWLQRRYGDEELIELWNTGPRALLAGPRQQ